MVVMEMLHNDVIEGLPAAVLLVQYHLVVVMMMMMMMMMMMSERISKVKERNEGRNERKNKMTN